MESKQGRGIVKLDDSHTHTHTRKKEKEVVEGLLLLLCEAFPHKAGACPFVGLQLSIGTSHLFLFLRNPKTAAYLYLSLSFILPLRYS